MVNFDELKVLLTLNDGKRLDYLEHSIFTDTRCEVIWYYLSELMRSQTNIHNIRAWHYPIEHHHDAERVVYFYSTEIIGSRWTEAEFILDPSLYWTKRYREHFQIGLIQPPDESLI